MIIRIYIVFLLPVLVFGIVPTTDVAQQTQDATAMANYTAQVSNSVAKMNMLTTAGDQVKNLNGLAKLQAGTTLCELCTKTDRDQLEAYKASINSDLCSQFSLAYTNITGIKTTVNTLNEVMSLLTTNPKAAMMALQQAATSAQVATNNTLAQMQMLEAQKVQKSMAEEKIGNQNHDAQIKGATHVSY